MASNLAAERGASGDPGAKGEGALANCTQKCVFRNVGGDLENAEPTGEPLGVQGRKKVPAFQ